MKKILILIAMFEEASLLINKLGAVELPGVFGNLPMRAFQKGTVTIIVNGTDSTTGVSAVATQPAAIAAQLGIMMFNPDIIISAGTAGAFKKHGTKIGEVLLGARHQFHDRRIPIPGFSEYGIGNFQSALPVELIEKIGLKMANVSTGNSLDYTERDLEIIKSMGHSLPILKEMEGAAIAQVAAWNKIMFFSIKSVTDLIDGDKPSFEEFQVNLKLAVERLTAELEKILGAIV